MCFSGEPILFHALLAAFPALVAAFPAALTAPGNPNACCPFSTLPLTSIFSFGAI